MNLVIVGQEGWRGLSDENRRDIPETVKKLREHPLAGKTLFWLNDASDECLEELYLSATYLLVTSAGEGFGLPLIEASRHNLKIIARELDVFKEVMGSSAIYFSGYEALDLANVVRNSLRERSEKRQQLYYEQHTWSSSAVEILKILFGKHFKELS